jgi:hypothetical protein
MADSWSCIEGNAMLRLKKEPKIPKVITAFERSMTGIGTCDRDLNHKYTVEQLKSFGRSQKSCSSGFMMELRPRELKGIRNLILNIKARGND